MTWTDKDRAASNKKRAKPKRPTAFKVAFDQVMAHFEIPEETAVVFWKMSACDGRARRNYKTIAGML